MMLTVAAATTMMGGCNYWDDIFGDVYPPEVPTPFDASSMSPSASLFVWGGNGSNSPTRTIIDQTTTRTLDSNFLRIDENIDGATNQGLYTYNDWNNSTVLEATVISSPDNTENIYYRSVTFAPTQVYSIYVAPYIAPAQPDTTFYHTRLVGWYPRNCTLQRNASNKPVSALFNNSRFSSVLVQDAGRYSVRFKNLLDGKTDLMMSNLKEGQQWHNDSGSETAYRQPFGHNEANPSYSNYLTYKHYLSAVRIWVYANTQTEQNLQTWGTIRGVTVMGQPTSCTIALPTALGEFGEVTSWYDRKNLPIITTKMYGAEDVNHNNDDYEATYPINMDNMNGSDSAHTPYLGYFLVQPGNSGVEISIRTKAGTFNATLPGSVTDEVTGITTQLFEASKIYDFKLNLKTDQSVDVYVQNEDTDNFKNLSKSTGVPGVFEMANCYIVDATTLDFTGEDYPGFNFIANFVGNGDDGIVSGQGSTQFHVTEAEITNEYSVDLIWESERGLLTNVQLQHGYIRFQVPGKMISGTRQAVEGNAVLAIKDSSGNVIWSWHIWITDPPQDITFSTGATIMDRNLGATAASFTAGGTGASLLETYGLYYQWGRKDPSPGPPTYNYDTEDMSIKPVYDYSTNAITSVLPVVGANTLLTGVRYPGELLYAINSPYYGYDWLYENINFLWGYVKDSEGNVVLTKTIYDPCPYGYRVAAEELQAIFALNPTYTPVSTSDGYGGLNVTLGGKTSFFPCAGYKGPDRGLPATSGGWWYVGQKGDYQGSYTSDVAGVSKDHRRRSYLSLDNSGWTELSVPGGTYTGYVTNDFTNRKTAASVRCVKIN